MILFVAANFFRGRRWRRANDEMPAAPLLFMLLFWVLFGMALLSGALAVTNAMTDSTLAAVVAGMASAACLAGSVALWRRLNRSRITDSDRRSV